MSVPATITLNSVVGTPGPFNLYSCTGSTCSVTPYVTGVTLSSLTGGYGTLAPDGTTHIKIKSTGVGCDFETAPISISGIPSLTPTPTPTATHTPTPTATHTPTPTPTNTQNTTIEPDYFYYAMGDCADMRYSYTAITNTGFGIITIPGCDTLSNIGNLSMQDPAHTSYILSNPLDPCGFGNGYSGVAIARSSTSITEGTVYSVGNQCLSVISVNSQYVTGFTINLDGQTPVGIGDAACGTCSPPFTGFTVLGYSGVTCGTSEPVIAYSILGGFTLGNVYGIQMYSGGTIAGNAICMTLTAELGPQFVLTDPSQGISGYQISDTGPVTFPISFSGYTDCTTCNSVSRKYLITGDRCDTTGSISVWSATLPTIQVGNTFQVDGILSPYCWIATQVDQYKSVVYNDLGWSIVDTGCDCNGNNGGGNVNVNNIVASATQASNTGGECQSPSGEYYSETTITEMNLIFRDSSNNPVTPNDTVQYRVNGGSWQTLTVTSSTVTFSVTLMYGDNSNCSGGSGYYADTLDVKVGTLTVLNYTAGSS
jgi:hypothetical protein